MLNRRALTFRSIGLAALLAAAGCSSDEGSDADSFDGTVDEAGSQESATDQPADAADAVDVDADDDGSSDGVAGFCAEIRTLQEEEASEDFTQGDVDRFRDLATRAPDEISDDLLAVADAFEQIVELGDTDDIEAVFSILFSQEVLDAGLALEEFGVAECGLEPSDSDDDAIDFSELDGLSGDEFVPDVSGVDSPLYNDFLEPPVDPNVASLDGLKAHLDLQYTDAEWRRNLDQFAIEGDAWEVGWSFGLDMTDSALDICAAVASYLADLSPDATIAITEFNDGTFEYDAVARGGASGSCERV